ncbi:MAG TPA: hypothetical protein VN946_09735 [Terriglobales bacterium]|jgi:hypothetical protein|nr:hypothetical protein [Terriglobales bacterium]
MAARVIPFEDSDTAQNISITDTDAIPEGYILTATQNSVTFTNNATSPVSIAFTPSDILTDISNLAVGGTSAAQTMPASASVNYCVTVGAVVNGPFAIQSGNGFMVVMVRGSAGNENCNPNLVAIPLGGNLQMQPAISTDGYTVNWTDGDPFIEPITKVDSATHTDDPADGTGEYPYTVTSVSIQGGGGNGGGRVIVVGT